MAGGRLATGSLAAALAEAPAEAPAEADGAGGFGVEDAAAAALLDGAGFVPLPAVEARNAPKPTATTAIAPPTTNRRRETPVGGGGRLPRRRRPGTPASGRSGGGSPPASTAKVWSGDQTSRTSSPGSHSSARVARWTFCS